MMRRALVDTALVALLLWGCVLPGQSGKKWSEQDFESALSFFNGGGSLAFRLTPPADPDKETT